MSEIEFIPSPNFWPGGPPKIRIVIHTIEGSLNSAINWFQNPASQASAHELLSLDGLRVVQMVNPDDRAWHAGTVAGVNKKYFWGDENENERSIGFELEGYAKNERPQAQMALLLERVRYYLGECPGIKIDRSNIVGHYQLSSDRSDPGASFPWDEFLARLKGESIGIITLNGFQLGHGFLSFFKVRGGIDIFGLPISEERQEHGKTVQWFERARFEYHPENPDPYKIQLGLIGSELLDLTSVAEVD